MSEKQSQFRRGTEQNDEASTEQLYEAANDEALSERVVAAVAAVSDADPTVMDPLAEAVDPDALDALFADRYDGATRDDGTVQFTFFGYEIVATGDGDVSVLETRQ